MTSITADNSGTDDTESGFDGSFICSPNIGSPNAPVVQLHPVWVQDLDYFSQELRLSGSINDNLDFMVGYTYYTNNGTRLPFGLPPGVLWEATAGFQGWGAPKTYAFKVRYSLQATPVCLALKTKKAT